MTKRLFFSIFNLCVSAFAATAQTPGSLDPNFGTNGIVVAPVGTANDQAFAMALQPDSKIVVVGNSYADATNQEDFFVQRYLSNGMLDPDFGSNGQVTTDFGASDDAAKAVAVQPDGKIVVAGYILGAVGGFNFAAARYLPDGSLDPNFGTGGKVMVNYGSSDFCLAMALQPDGKIVLAGRSYNGATGDFALARLLVNGSLDPDFGTDGKVRVDLFNENENINAIVIYPSGRIVAVGETSTSTTGAFAVAKFKANGDLDDTFGDAGKVRTTIGTISDAAYSVAIQLDGKLVVVGQSNSATISDLAVVRYRFNGALDDTFSGDGVLVDDVTTLGDYGYAVNVQADGKILVGGSSSGNQEDIALFRYLKNGAPDTDFGDNGKVFTDAGNSKQDRVLAMVVEAGKIIVAGQTGSFGDYDVVLAQYEQGTVVSAQTVHSSDLMAAIYPNPASMQTTVAFTLQQAEAIQIGLYNMQGQLIQQYSAGELSAGQQIVPIKWPLGTPAGLYRVELAGKRMVNLRLIIQ